MASALNLYVRSGPEVDVAAVRRALPPVTGGDWRVKVTGGGKLLAVDLRRRAETDEELIELAQGLSLELGAEVLLLAFASANDSVVYSHLTRGKTTRHIRTSEYACIAAAGEPEPWERSFLAAAAPGRRLKGISEGMDAELDAKDLSWAIAAHFDLDLHVFRA